MPPRRACDICYKRKIQCLIATPGNPCNWCSSQGRTCTFDRVTSNKRTTSDVVQALSQRVEELEEALQAARFTSTTAGSSPWSRDSNQGALSRATNFTPSPSLDANLGHINRISANDHHEPTEPTAKNQHGYRLSRCQLGSNWYFKGVGIFSVRGRQWVSETSGQRSFLENLDIFGDRTARAAAFVSDTPSDQSRILPPEATCRHLLTVFLESVPLLVFPVIDRILFEDTITKAYDADSSDRGRQSCATACIWAMLAFFTPTLECQQSNLVSEPKECIEEAKHLLFVNNGSAANLDILQANLLLWVYQKTRGQCQEASTYFTSACRAVCELGGHFLPSQLVMDTHHLPRCDEHTRVHIRRLFQLCYCFDKDISLGSGFPPLLSSEHCDVRLRGEYEHELTQYNDSRNIDLAKIKERASRLLCAPQAFRYTDVELLMHVRQLDNDIEEWRLSIDPIHRPRLSGSIDTFVSMPSQMSPKECTHMVNLQLDYLFTMINIHSIVRRCGDLERSLSEDMHSVIHSSTDLSLEACRSIFRFLNIVVELWGEDSVWVVMHYAPMAAMPILVNVLIHPVGPVVDSDLLVLSSIASITRKVPTENLSKDAKDQIQEVERYIMELVRLGHSAAWKARKDGLTTHGSLM